MDKLFERFGAVGPDIDFGARNGRMVPRLDIRETDGEIRISAEMPGVEDKDIEVSIANDMLTIRGEKKVERDEEKEDYTLSERSYGTFERRMSLPAGIDPDAVKAGLTKGVLSITLPVPAETVEKRHRIDIETAA